MTWETVAGSVIIEMVTGWRQQLLHTPALPGGGSIQVACGEVKKERFNRQVFTEAGIVIVDEPTEES